MVTIPNNAGLPTSLSVKLCSDSGIIQSSNLILARERVNYIYFGSTEPVESSKARLATADRCLLLMTLAGALTLSTDVLAQEAASIKLGETDLTPAIRLEYVSIDNVYRKATDEVSGSGVLVKPELSWQADRRLVSLSAQYNGNYGRFSEDGLDYDNHFLGLTGVGDLSSKQRFETGLSFSKYAEPQGTGQTSNVLTPLDEEIEISIVTARAQYTYGARNSRGNLRGGLVAGSVSYSNLEQFTDGDDYSYVRPYGVFSLRISPDTRVLTELRFTSYDYDDDIRDRSQVALLVGVEMSASSKLSGDARIGVAKASFDENSDDDTTDLIAEVGMQYSPVSYGRFDIDFNRSLSTEDQSTNNVGRSIDDVASIAWTHDWSSRFQTRSTLSLDISERECPGVDDQNLGFGLELNFKARRWLQFGISGAQLRRTVTDCDDTPSGLEELDYDRAVVGVHVRATL